MVAKEEAGRDGLEVWGWYMQKSIAFRMDKQQGPNV